MARTFMHKIMDWERTTQACLLKKRPLKYIYNSCFDDPSMERTILAAMPGLAEFEMASQQIKQPKGSIPELAELYLEPLLTKDQEQHLFRKMNFLKHKASKLINDLNPEQVQQESLRRIQRLLNEATKIKQLIAKCNIRLAWEFAQRKEVASKRNQMIIGNLLSEAHLTLMRAISAFDYARGFKFSTYAVGSIKSDLNRAAYTKIQRDVRWQTGFDMTLNAKMDNYQYEQNLEHEDQRQKARLIIEDLLRHLTPVRRMILRNYFGLDGREYNLEQIGEQFKVTKERIRQLKNQGIKRLQELAAEKNLDLEKILCGKTL